MASKGIDVSVWQGDIDFGKVKSSGIDFVIIRAGYGRLVSQKDTCFEKNYAGAKSAGLHTGAYWYSYADSADAARLEAQACISVLKGKQFDFPIYFDIEEQSQLSRGRDFCSSLIKAFCDTMEAAGYFAGFYTSASHARSVVTDAVRERYAFWCAQWADSCSFSGKCGLWQYSSKGSVPGISGDVDLDLGYADYPDIIVKGGFNGYQKSGEDEPGPAEEHPTRKREDVVAQALAWLGRNEADGSHKEIIDVYNSHKPLARGYAMTYADPWCAAFVSAVSIRCKTTDVLPTECGCGPMIRLFQNLGEWVENDAYVPRPGDVIFYDWDDSGAGDNTGDSDHVGLVQKVSDGFIFVIEGNCSDAVQRRRLEVNGRYIRGFGVPRYTDSASEDTDDPQMPAEEQPVPGLPTLRQGAKNMYVAAMQFSLVNRGYSVGKWGIDGEFGRDTLGALKNYQAAAGLTADGVCGPTTWAKLKIE